MTETGTGSRIGKRVLMSCVIGMLLFAFAAGSRAQQPVGGQGLTSQAAASAAPGAEGRKPATENGTYTLPAEKLQKAKRLARARLWLNLGSTAWGILLLILLLTTGSIAFLRDRAVCGHVEALAAGAGISSRVALPAHARKLAIRCWGTPSLFGLWPIHPALGQLVLGLDKVSYPHDDRRHSRHLAAVRDCAAF